MVHQKKQAPVWLRPLFYIQKFRQPLPVKPYHCLSVYDRGWGGEAPPILCTPFFFSFPLAERLTAGGRLAPVASLRRQSQPFP